MSVGVCVVCGEETEVASRADGIMTCEAHSGTVEVAAAPERKPIPPERAPVLVGERGVAIQTLDDLGRFAMMVAKSDAFAAWKRPKAEDSAAIVAVAVQMGMELGMTPARALQSFYPMGGRVELYGAAALGLLRSSGVCVSEIEVGTSGEGDGMYGYIRFQRRGGEAREVTFGFAEAKAAGIVKSGGAWEKYRADMLVWRALARASRRYFSDVTMGLPIVEAREETTPRRLVAPETDEPDPALGAVIGEE